jgi:hypothetical protein
MGSVERTIKELSTIKAKAAEGPLQPGVIAQLLEQTVDSILRLLTQASPLPHRRPSTLDLYSADENGNSDSFLVSIPMPKKFPSIVVATLGGDFRYFAYDDRSGLFIETDPYKFI